MKESPTVDPSIFSPNPTVNSDRMVQIQWEACNRRTPPYGQRHGVHDRFNPPHPRFGPAKSNRQEKEESQHTVVKYAREA